MDNQEKTINGLALGRGARTPNMRPTLKPLQFSVSLSCLDCYETVNRPTSEKESKCPSCGSSLHYMGRQFKAPSKDDDDAWQVVKKLWQAGFRFAGHRNIPGAEPLPEKLSEVDDFITRNPDHPLKHKA